MTTFDDTTRQAWADRAGQVMTELDALRGEIADAMAHATGGRQARPMLRHLSAAAMALAGAAGDVQTAIDRVTKLDASKEAQNGNA